MRKRILFAVLSVVVGMMAFSFAGCGAGEEDSSSEESSGEAAEFVYVADYMDVDLGDSMSNVVVKSDAVYYMNYNFSELEDGSYGYVLDFYRLVYGEKEAEKLAVSMVDGDCSIMGFQVDEDGNIVMLLADYSSERISEDGWYLPDYTLAKYNADGTMAWEADITEALAQVDYAQYLSLDAEGHIYVSSDAGEIFLFDGEGSFRGSVSYVNDWIYGMGQGRDGSVYVAGDGTVTMIDYEKAALGETYSNFPVVYGSDLVAGKESDFLVSTETALYAYDLETETKTEILNWLSCSINGEYVTGYGMTESGQVVVLIDDWALDEFEMAYLTRTPASEVEEKTTITIGVFSTSQALQAAAVNFNKENDQYQIVIKEYYDSDNWTEDSYDNALTAMNNDITSGSGADLFDLSDVDIQNLVAKGVLEDLGSYLDESQNLDREDFVSSVLAAYTYDDVLTCIPTGFMLTTIFGRASQVGEEMGWTVEEMMAFVDANSDTLALTDVTNSSFLLICLMMNQSYFVDWSAGTCNFDSQEFKDILEFASHFDDDYNYDDDNYVSTESMVASGQVLLYETSLYSPEEISVISQIFGEEVTAIGLPTVDGSAGVMLYASGDLLGISAASSCKEGAWEFLEYYLEYSKDSIFTDWSFSSFTSELEQGFAEAMEKDYETDEDGNILLDENGEPVEASQGGYGYGDGFTVEVYACTEEQIAMLRELIDAATAMPTSDSDLISIILEEAEAYFAGDKDVDEVAEVIQSRASLYIGEQN